MQRFTPDIKKLSFPLLSGNIDEICKQNPKAILRKKDNCAQYYNCSVTNSQYGGHLQECKYPDLFSTVSRRCENFKTVPCDNRTEPQAPCELIFVEFILIKGKIMLYIYRNFVELG
jgi:hypothetical protein